MTDRPCKFGCNAYFSIFALITVFFVLLEVNSYAFESCKDISISQSGITLSARNGLFQLRRQPFTISYGGQSKSPSITLSQTSALNMKLQASGRSRVLASAGDYMALYPNDIVLLDEFSLFDNQEGRNTFAGLIGDGYPELVEKMVSEDSELSLATGIPKASSGFEYNLTEKRYDYLINKINEKPLSQTDFTTLYLTYFSVLDERSPSPEQEPQMRLLQVVSWGSCTITFK